MKQDDVFQVNFDHFKIKHHFLKAGGAVVLIGSALKSNHHKQIKFSFLKSVKRSRSALLEPVAIL